MKNNGTFGLIDDLTISYDGNQLVKVTDDAEALNYNGALDFNDGDDSTCEYDYDSNGALTRDSNRGINSITYDYGHHIYKVNLNMTSGPRNIRNDYTPDGRKLSSTHLTHIPTVHGYYTKTTKELYIDGLILRGNTALMWQFGGYVELNTNGTPTSWNYYVTDHLGSTRMVVDSNDSIKETVNYYPFGSEMRMQNPALLNSNSWQRFRFTGKELDRQNGVNMYDFGARWYDVAGVPMWTSMDPLCEKYYSVSPYAYCAGNPVNAIDPYGMDIWDIDINGNIVNHTETDDYDKIIINNHQSPQFDYGTISHHALRNDDGLEYDLFTINGDDNGRSIFEMAAKNTDVEWSLGQFDGKSGLPNILTTSHKEDAEGGLIHFLGDNTSRIMSLNRFDHNHPGGTFFPSSKTLDDGSLSGDMGIVVNYNILYPENHINYSIYTLSGGCWQYHPYKEGMKMIYGGKETEMQEVIVTGRKNCKIK